MDGEPLCYHGPPELWSTAGLSQKINFSLKFYVNVPKENKESKLCEGAGDFFWLTVYMSAYHGVSFCHTVVF